MQLWTSGNFSQVCSSNDTKTKAFHLQKRRFLGMRKDLGQDDIDEFFDDESE